MSRQVGLSTFVTPVAKTGKPLADEGERIEKANRPRPADRLSDQRDGGDYAAAAGLDRPAGIGFNSGVGCLGQSDPPSP